MGEMQTSVECLHCHYVSETTTPFLDLSIPVPTDVDSTDLNKCLSVFMESEIMEDDNMINCSKCQCHRMGIKSTSIKKLPRILVIRILFCV